MVLITEKRGKMPPSIMYIAVPHTHLADPALLGILHPKPLRTAQPHLLHSLLHNAARIDMLGREYALRLARGGRRRRLSFGGSVSMCRATVGCCGGHCRVPSRGSFEARDVLDLDVLKARDDLELVILKALHLQ